MSGVTTAASVTSAATVPGSVMMWVFSRRSRVATIGRKKAR
jgi:hypothetical protein